MIKRKSKKGVWLLVAILLITFCGVALAGSFSKVYASDEPKEKAVLDNAAVSQRLEASGIRTTDQTGQKDSEGRTILGETADGGIVSCSADLEALTAQTFGDRVKSPISTFAAGWDDGTIYSHDFTLNGSTITTTSPIIYISDNGADTIAYCADPTLNVPSESAGAGVKVTYIKDSTNVQSFRIRNVMYWGYHPGQSGEYYVQTWAAIRVIAGISSYSDYYMTDPVVADLVNKKSYQDPPNWNAAWSIIAEREEAVWNPKTARQETGWFQTQCTNISEHGQYTVKLPEGVHAICRRTNGETYGDYTGSFTIYDDDDFMLYADGKYQGDVAATITPTTIKRHTSDASNPDACVIYKPDIPNTQRLFVSLATGQSPLSGSFKAHFSGATGGAKLVKSDSRTGDKLAGAVFGIYRAQDDALIAQGTTNAQGEWSIDNLVFGDYYFKEIAAPDYYEHNAQQWPLTVDGIRDVVTVTATNDEKQVPFEFTKKNIAGQPLKDVTFVLYYCDKAHSHVDLRQEGITDCWQTKTGEATSNAEGIVDFGELYSGDYQLVEIKTVEGYALPYGQWRIHIDAEAENPVTITTKGNAPAFTQSADDGFSVVNQENYRLPNAGGTGSQGSMILGVIVIIIAAAGIGVKVYHVYHKSEDPCLKKNQIKEKENNHEDEK